MTKSDKIEKSIDMAFEGTLGSAVGASIGIVGVFLWETSIASALPALGDFFVLLL